MGNKRKHSKIFDPTDEERTEVIQKAKTHHKKYGVVDMDRKREWLKQRGYAFQLYQYQIIKEHSIIEE